MSTNLKAAQTDLRQLVEKVAVKERRVFSFSIVFTVVAVIAGGAWLWFAYHQVQSLDRQYAQKIADQNSKIEIKDNELNDKKKMLEDRQRDLEKLEGDIAQRKKDIDDLNKYYAGLVRQISNGDKQNSDVIVKNSLNANPQVAKLIPQIYLQIGNEDQRDRARKIQQQLQKNGYLAPGVENVGSKSPGQTKLKYFHADKKPEAEQLGRLLQSLGINVGSPQYIKGFEDSSKVRARQYEIWFGSDF